MAMFLAFDPWGTCLRMPPSSFGYFSAAERSQLISPKEASELLRLLLDLGITVSGRYQGYFAPFFQEHKTRVIFEHAGQLGHLGGAGLALGSSHPDVLFGACPWPIVPERHLLAKQFRLVNIRLDISHYRGNLWSAWTEALDILCLGLWAGLTSKQIALILEALHPEKRIETGAFFLNQTLNYQCKRVSIPIFSNGFQGNVVGNFTGLDVGEEESIATALLQFGQTLADIYVDLRSRHFFDRIFQADSLDALARAFVFLLSPVETLIVDTGGDRCGYQILRECGYWAGYTAMDDASIAHALEATSFLQVRLPSDFSGTLFVQPVSAGTVFDAELAKVSLHNCLARHFNQLSRTSNGKRLTLADVDHLRGELESGADDGQQSLAKLRQIYVLDKISKTWAAGRVAIYNIEMKRYLEGKRGYAVKNGYQISSYLDEILKPFHGRLSAAKNRKGITLQWRT